MPLSLKLCFVMSNRPSSSSTSTGLGRDVYSSGPVVNSPASKLLSDYRKRSVLSSEEFNQWLADNYSSLSDYYKNQLYNAYNTYASQSFEPTFLQGLEEAFGFEAARQNFENSRWTTLNDSIADILAASYSENYQDPVNEVARRRAAGLNDDLSGGSSIGTGEPGDIRTPENAVPALNDGSSSIIEVAQYGISFVSSIMEFAKGIQSLQSGNLLLASQDIANHNDAMDLIANEVMNGLSVSEIQDIKQIDDTVFLDYLGGLTKDNSFNPSTKRVLNRYYHTMKGESGTARLQTMKMELANRYFNSRRQTAGFLSDPLFDDDFIKYVGNIGERFSKLQQDLFEAQTKFQTKHAQNDLLLEGSRFESDKAGYDSNSAIGVQRAIIEGFFTDIYKDLQAGDKWYHKVGLVLLPLFRGLVSKLFTPSISGGSSTDSKGNKSSSFSLGF